MSDEIQAAWITGGLTVVSALATIIAAWIALKSWRRHALGSRQITLAEECLLSLWKLDKSIRAARLIIPPNDIGKLKSNPTFFQNHYRTNHQRAMVEINKCQELQENFSNLLLISEFYLGTLPRVKFKGTSRFFKIDYEVSLEYNEIIMQLRVLLFDTSPEIVERDDLSEEARLKFEVSGNLFYGFLSDHEEDEYSKRLKFAKQTLERYLRSILRRRNFVERIRDRVSYWVSDYYDRRSKPTMVNKHKFKDVKPTDNTMG